MWRTQTTQGKSATSPRAVGSVFSLITNSLSAATGGVTPVDRAGKERAMRVIVIGATGNVGTSVLRSLENEDQVESILGLARRLPRLQMRKVEWNAADVTKDDLVPNLRGADAVVLLAWLKQPSRDLNKLWMNNVEGSMRVAGAVKEAGVPVLLYASSIGTYSPAPKDQIADSTHARGERVTRHRSNCASSKPLSCASNGSRIS
jgi:nucleoside-diphosphate-sugar epimerase